MTHLLNPFDKKDKPGSSFFDRVGIAVLCAGWILMTITLPFYIIHWHKHAPRKARIRFWIAIIAMITIGDKINLFLFWTQTDEAPGFVRLCSTIFIFILLYYMFKFLKSYFLWLADQFSRNSKS